MGVPGLKGHDLERVSRDDDAAEFLLAELQAADHRGSGAARENLANSLRWLAPTEMDMLASGRWWDTYYHACVLQGTRKKNQCLRHNILEISQWRDMTCHHTHHPKEWEPISMGGRISLLS